MLRWTVPVVVALALAVPALAQDTPPEPTGHAPPAPDAPEADAADDESERVPAAMDSEAPTTAPTSDPAATSSATPATTSTTSASVSDAPARRIGEPTPLTRREPTL